MITWILSALLFIVLGFIYSLIPYNFPSKELRYAVNKLPGPKPLPIIGNTDIINVPSSETYKVLFKLINEYGNRIRLWMLGNPIVFLSKAKDLQVVLSSSEHIKKSAIYDLIKPWLGDGLLISSGEKWFLHRKLLTNAFHFQILSHHETVTYHYSKILLDLLEPHAQSGNPFNIYPYITNCTLDIICDAAMGVPVDAQLKGSIYAKSINKISSLTRQRMVKFWLRHPLAFRFSPEGREYYRLLKIIHGFANDVIKKRKITFEQNKTSQINNDEDRKEKLSFLDLLLEVSINDSRIGDKEIREEVDTFMFEGHDTTSAVINWCLFLLGNHPEIQEQVLEEVDNAMQFTETSKRLKELSLLERCIKETLRLYPSVPTFSRVLTSSLKLDGLSLPSGTNLIIHPYIVHRDPEVFPDPEKFDPDRFLPDRNQGRNPYAYFPFSAGPRNCIGKKFAMIETKLVLSMILSQFRIKTLETPENIGVSPELVLKPCHEISTIIYKRNK